MGSFWARTSLRGYGTLKYGYVYEKTRFPGNTGFKALDDLSKHFETILPNFPLLMSVKFKGSARWYKFFHVATAVATAAYNKNVTKTLD